VIIRPGPYLVALAGGELVAKPSPTRISKSCFYQPRTLGSHPRPLGEVMNPSGLSWSPLPRGASGETTLFFLILLFILKEKTGACPRKSPRSPSRLRRPERHRPFAYWSSTGFRRRSASTGSRHASPSTRPVILSADGPRQRRQTPETARFMSAHTPLLRQVTASVTGTTVIDAVTQLTVAPPLWHR